MVGIKKSKILLLGYNKLQQNEPIQIVTDQLNSPTFVKNLAEIIIKLIDCEENMSGDYRRGA